MKKITNSKECLALKCCCVFPKKDLCILPYFSSDEAAKVGKGMLTKKGTHLFQAKSVPSLKQKGMHACAFLDEASHKCTIYGKRPLECSMWPFIVGKDKKKGGLYLYISDETQCPAVKRLKKKEKLYFGNLLLKSLIRKNFFREINDKKRYIWPSLGYYEKVLDLHEFIEKEKQK